MLRQRILTAAVLLPLALAALFLLPSLAWSGLTAAVMVIGGWEWGRLAGWNSRGRALFATLVGGSCIAVLAVLESSLPGATKARIETAVLLGAMIFWLGVALPWVAWRWHLRTTLPLALAGVEGLLHV